MHSQHVEARSLRGRKIVTFHGSNAIEAAKRWDADRRLLDTARNRKTSELTFHLVTTHEEPINLEELN